MGTPSPTLRTHNIVFVPVNSEAQPWHCDDNFRRMKVHRYFTILIHLNSIDSVSGGTEIWSSELKRSDLVISLVLRHDSFLLLATDSSHEI
jgi:hypothetical protein